MSGLRTLPEDFSANLRTDQGMTLIIIRQSGLIEYAIRDYEKDALLTKRQPTDKLLLAWTGRYRTDIFELRDADLHRHYQRVRQ